MENNGDKKSTSPGTVFQPNHTHVTEQLLIRPMLATDIRRGFCKAISALSPVELDEEEFGRIFRQRLRAKIDTYVAVLNGTVVGTASLFIELKYLHAGGRVGHIEDVAVQQEHQGHGIGQALVRVLLDRCREAGCYKVILDCEPKNIPYYEKQGFHRWCQAMRQDIPLAATAGHPPE